MQFEEFKQYFDTSWTIRAIAYYGDDFIQEAQGLPQYLPSKYCIIEKFGPGMTKDEAMKAAQDANRKAKTKSLNKLKEFDKQYNETNFLRKFFDFRLKRMHRELKSTILLLETIDIEKFQVGVHYMESNHRNVEHIKTIFDVGDKFYIANTYKENGPFDIREVEIESRYVANGSVEYQCGEDSVADSKFGFKTGIYGEHVFLTMEEAQEHMHNWAYDKVGSIEKWLKSDKTDSKNNS